MTFEMGCDDNNINNYVNTYKQRRATVWQDETVWWRCWRLFWRTGVRNIDLWLVVAVCKFRAINCPHIPTHTLPTHIRSIWRTDGAIKLGKYNFGFRLWQSYYMMMISIILSFWIKSIIIELVLYLARPLCPHKLCCINLFADFFIYTIFCLKFQILCIIEHNIVDTHMYGMVCFHGVIAYLQPIYGLSIIVQTKTPSVCDSWKPICSLARTIHIQ